MLTQSSSPPPKPPPRRRGGHGAAASHFSGTAFMPSQRAGAAAPAYSVGAAAVPSPSKSGDPCCPACVPITILHISRSFAAAAAADGSGDPVFSVDGVETPNVRVLGRVVSVVERETDVSFTLDDGTGKIDILRWITDQPDVLEAAFIQEGVYVKVHVTLMGFQAKKHGVARSIRPVTNFNEVVLHFIECMRVHMENARTKMQGQLPPAVQTNAYTHVPYSGGVTEHQVHFTQVNQGQLPHAVQTNISTHVPFSAMSGYQAHFAHQVNQGKFPPTVQTNTSTHLPFSSGVREHQIYVAPQVNQFSSYLSTGGQQHDLQRMVLEVMQKPDIMPVTNFSEVVQPFYEFMHAHLENARTKMQGQLPPPVQIDAYPLVPFSGGSREQQAHFTQGSQGQLLPAVQTNTSGLLLCGEVREQKVHIAPQSKQMSAYLSTCGLHGDLERMVLDVTQKPDNMPFKSIAYPNPPLTLISVSKECEREICVPVLLLSNFSDPGICCFLPYTRNSFKRVDVAIDIDDVLYSNGEWLLLREDRNISLWEVNREQKWFVSQVDGLVHRGHFIGKPPHEATIVLARQHPPKENGDDAVTDFWLKISGNDGWKKESVECAYEQRGLNSLTIYQGKVFWLNDAGRLCCVKESSNGIQFKAWEDGIGVQSRNLSLVEHCNDLYVVSSGSFLPLQVAVVHQVTDNGSFPLLNGLSGKSIFTSPMQSGFVLPSLHSDDNKVYTANMFPNVDCAMHSYKNDVTESIRRCSYLHHLGCSTAWAVLRTGSHGLDC